MPCEERQHVEDPHDLHQQGGGAEELGIAVRDAREAPPTG